MKRCQRASPGKKGKVEPFEKERAFDMVMRGGILGITKKGGSKQLRVTSPKMIKMSRKGASLFLKFTEAKTVAKLRDKK